MGSRLGRPIVREIGASESIPPRPEGQKGRPFRGRARRLPVVSAAVATGDDGCRCCCTVLVSFSLHVLLEPPGPALRLRDTNMRP